MEYHVACSCGASIPVTAAQAGAEVECPCGARVPVPRLSALRTQAGLGAYESGPIDTIRRMIAEGALPWGKVCAVSGRPTDDVIELHVQCERSYSPRGSSPLVLYFWPLLALIDGARSERREILGRDTVVCVPLRVAQDFHHRLARRTGQRTLRRLLRGVPVYARLLQEYPQARVTVGASYIGGCWASEKILERFRDLFGSFWDIGASAVDERQKPKGPDPEL